MRRHASVSALGIVLACALAGCSAMAGQPVNLLSNGGFEEGMAGWEPDPKHELAKGRGVARSGEGCVTGEVTQASQALTLKRSVNVRAGNLYRFSIWARATNRTKLVLWAMLPGARRRTLIAAWPRVAKKWTRYAAGLTIERDGTLELHIIAPSSYGEPPGRIWLDDVALAETKMPKLTAVSKGLGFNDEPALAPMADGSLAVAWNSFRAGADALQVAVVTPEGQRYRTLGAWQALGGEGICILGIRAVPAGRGAMLVYAAEVKKNWDVYALPVRPTGPGAATRLTASKAVDAKPAAAWHEGRLWVAWESNRNGGRQIFLSSVRDGSTEPAAAASAPGASSYCPALAVLPSGEVCVAWHSFRQNNYDIYLRRRSPGGTWSAARRLTKAPSIDRHPVLLTRGSDLWLLYENARTERYNIGRTNRRRIIVAKVTAKGLLSPAKYRASPLYGRCEAPSAAFDASGRLWLAYLKPRPPRSGWDALLTCYDGGAWKQPIPVSSRKGMDRRPQLVVAGSRAVVCVQNDDIPRSWSDVDRTPKAKSDIYLAGLDLDPAARGGGMALEPLAEPDEPFEPAALRVERGEEMPTPSITYKGHKLNLYFGDLHEHSALSVCNRLGDQSVDESYQHMRDIVRHDFACVTDHGYNINPYLWSFLGKLARVNDDPGRYLTFLGEEWTSTFEKYSTKHPYGYYGHRNLVFADPYFPRWWNARNGQTPAQVWEELRKLDANFVQIPHQLADTGNVPTDWDFTDETAQPVAEIFQTRGSYEHKGTPREARRTTPRKGYFLQDAWARGIVIGVIASPDHGGGYGKACVWAPELTREAILDAIRARHCYGTTAAKIVLDVRVDGHLMGEKVPAPAGKTVEVNVTARCPAPIDRIEVCRNNKFIYTHTPPAGPTPPAGSKPAGGSPSRPGPGRGSRSATFTFTDRSPLPGRSYYYVRVLQKDGEIAWSSPVWLGAK